MRKAILWLALITALVSSPVWLSHASETYGSPNDAIKQSTIDFISIKKVSLRTGAFDTVMLASFMIVNDSVYDVKDLEITITSYGKSGTKVDTNKRVLYDIVKSKHSKAFKNFNMGFVHSQANDCEIKVTDLKIVK